MSIKTRGVTSSSTYMVGGTLRDWRGTEFVGTRSVLYATIAEATQAADAYWQSGYCYVSRGYKRVRERIDGEWQRVKEEAKA